MSEWTIGLFASLKCLIITVSATLYWIGGRQHKWIRRIGSPIVLIGGTLVCAYLQKSFHLLMCASLPFGVGAFCMGYGGNTFLQKLRRRALYGFMLGMIGLSLVIVTHQWLVFGVQLFLSVFMSVIFGVFNPLHAAAEEETVICVAGTCLVPFMI